MYICSCHPLFTTYFVCEHRPRCMQPRRSLSTSRSQISRIKCPIKFGQLLVFGGKFVLTHGTSTTWRVSRREVHALLHALLREAAPRGHGAVLHEPRGWHGRLRDDCRDVRFSFMSFGRLQQFVLALRNIRKTTEFGPCFTRFKLPSKSSRPFKGFPDVWPRFDSALSCSCRKSR